MNRSDTCLARQLSLKGILLVFIFISIFGIITFLSVTTYIEEKQYLVDQNRYLQQYTEMNIVESLRLVDNGLNLLDDTLNRQMNSAFVLFLNEYNTHGGNPAGIDLSALREQIRQKVDGDPDLYIINETGVIVYSTVPDVLYLDFKQYPEFYASITALRLGDTFSADRVVRSVTNASEGSVTGQLRKFAFMPTPDHRYLLEMGLTSGSFDAQREELSYAATAESLEELNPGLTSIRLFDSNRVLIRDGEPDPEFTPDDALASSLDTVFRTGNSLELQDTINGSTVRYLFIDLSAGSGASDMSLVAELTYSDAVLNEKLDRLLLYHLSIGVLAIVMGALFAYGTSRYITRPIDEIVEDVDIIARGDLDHSIRGMKRIEFERLENSINLMIRRIRDYSEEIERGKAELQIAAEIQRTFLPRTLPELEGFDIAAVTIPAKEVGGDFYDIIPLGSGKTGIVIADVSGKGISAALFMVLSQTALRMHAAGREGVGGTMERANTFIAADATSGMFVTLFHGIINQKDRTLVYANAGHNPPIHFHAQTREFSFLPLTGMAMGILDDETYGEREVSLSPGDLVALYTDGVTEAINEQEEQFGEERLRQILSARHSSTSREIIDAILKELNVFCGKQPQFDDITLLIIKVKP